MKRIFLSPYISFLLIGAVCIGSGWLILNAISKVNFEYLTEQQALSSE